MTYLKYKKTTINQKQIKAEFLALKIIPQTFIHEFPETNEMQITFQKLISTESF